MTTNLNTTQIRNPTLLDTALARLPDNFRERIIETYLEVKKRYVKSIHTADDFDALGLSCGKFCETILRFLQQELTGAYIAFGAPIPNFSVEVDKLLQLPRTTGNDSTRILIPRALSFVYTMRNKRGIGHTGGDVEANGIDGATTVRIADWIVCELIRIYHNLSLEEAQEIVDALATRNIPEIWEINGKKRILKKGLTFKQKVLLMVYADTQDGGVAIEDLFEWTEYTNKSMFRKQVILPLHKEKFIDFDQETGFIHISPLGIKEVEEIILKMT